MNLQDYMDIIAVPCFLLMIYYFILKKNRIFIENFLLLFAIIGFIFDSTILFKNL